MTAIQNTLHVEELLCNLPISFWPFLTIPLVFCLLPVLIILLHPVMTDPVARAQAPLALWPLMLLYTLLIGSYSPVRQPIRVIKLLEYDDPVATTTWRGPDPPLDGAEDPPS